jgi:DNA replication licensing factor MCM5
MVLADGGIVCIDEFDKMKVQDRVAIHEAMEQQTISIAKAGITTVLNSRTAVLAAANPNFGSYDEMRSTSENFEEFRTTILSRFDCIFLIKDIRSSERDLQIATHVMDVHKNAFRERDDTSQMAIPLLTLKNYISYCRAVCEPRLSAHAAEILINKYVSMRSQHRTREIEGSNSIPITVRQLEAVVRLSESLAKMTLSLIATEEHVEEALRLFNVSTVDAINSGHVVTDVMSDKTRQEIEMIERIIKQRLGQNSSMSEKRLVEAISQQFNMPEPTIRRALQVMATKGELEFQSKGKYVKRK